MWTVRISKAQFDLLLHGKAFEVPVEAGLVTVDQDDEGRLTIRFLTKEEAGLRI